jgi:hypothetical protein
MKVSFDTGYSGGSTHKIVAARSSNFIVAPISVENSQDPGISGDQQTRKAFVSPYEVEFDLNPWYYRSLAGPSNKPSEPLSEQLHVQDLDLKQVPDYNPVSLRPETSDMGIQTGTTSSDANRVRMRESTPDSITMNVDTEQGEAAWPLSNEDISYHPNQEVQMDIEQAKSTPEHDKMEVDAVSTFSPIPRAAGPSRALSPPLVSNLAPRKRVAVLDLPPLETDNGKAERSNDQSKGRDSHLNQRRRPNQRTLMPKSSSPRDLKTLPSPQSSKSTPDSARTDSSFASTATHVTLPGSAITTPSSAEIRSPANASSPGENYLTCRDCGKTFQTPGQQKCVFPFTKVCSSPTMKSNPASSNILTRPPKETLQSSTQPTLRMRYLYATLWRKGRPRSPRIHCARGSLSIREAIVVHYPWLSNAEQGMDAQG